MSDWIYAAVAKADSGEPIYDAEDAATPPLVTTKGYFDEGFQIAYSKEGVCSICYTTGTLLVPSPVQATYTSIEPVSTEAEIVPIDPENPHNGSFSVDLGNGATMDIYKVNPVVETEVAVENLETKVAKQVTLVVTSDWGREVLQGQDVAMTASISEDYKLSEEGQILLYGKRELYKTVQNAKGATWESTRVPLKIEPGMTLIGESSLYGIVHLYVTSLSRTTDAQQGTITTTITGTIAYSGASSETVYLEDKKGWV
jgi:hypothetical protein